MKAVKYVKAHNFFKKVSAWQKDEEGDWFFTIEDDSLGWYPYTLNQCFPATEAEYLSQIKQTNE
jgi:hypothetical protein